MAIGVSNKVGVNAVQTAVIDVSEATFEREVLQRSQTVPVVIDFWAPWCGPCRVLGPTLERLAREADGAWVLAKINVDENPRLAQMFRVQGIPAVKAVYQGKIVDEFTGALPESQVRAWLKRIVPDRNADLLAMAQALEATNPAEAIARYRLILGQDPKNETALFNLGRLLTLRGDPEGITTLKQVPAGSPFGGRAIAGLAIADLVSAPTEPAEGSEGLYRQAAAAVRNGDYTTAIEHLLTLVGRDRAFRDDGARKALLGLFALLGDDHPLVGPARRRLANLLF
ncbi:MAG: tetratricopeptide repeat protein [Chloroflexus sp.]|nr:tetratricopeptide repeat protein [Chloroflexus sp.]